MHHYSSLSNSDHYGVSLTLEWNRVSGTSRKSSIRLYHLGDYNKACRMIEETDWNCMLSNVNASQAASLFSDRFLAIMPLSLFTEETQLTVAIKTHNPTYSKT